MKIFSQFAQLVYTLPAVDSSRVTESKSASLVSAQHTASSPASVAPLKGRFLHLTDLHPDPYYRWGTTEANACHYNKRKKYDHESDDGDGPRAAVKGEFAEEEEEDDGDGSDDELAEAVTASLSGPKATKKRGGSAQHKKKKKRRRHRERKSGYFGLPVSDCDSPLALINATFDWLGEHFRDQVDFVVWTGDNARHDIDSRLPRSLAEIQDLNRFLAERVRSVLGPKVPVVVSIANNDAWPHNQMQPGPNRITNFFADLWENEHFVPESSRKTVARGAYYSVEAIKGDLLLVSLNTLYFFEKNAIVDGCPPVDDEFLSTSPTASRPHLDPSLHPTSPRAAELFNAYIASLRDSRSTVGAQAQSAAVDPGTEHLLWLEQQLVLSRAQGMQVWLTGHVPATRENWYPGCFASYAKLVLAYQDTIVGQLFGHMNVDFVSFISDADASPSSSRLHAGTHAHSPRLHGHTVHSSSGDVSTLDLLARMYSSLPARHKLHERDFAPVHVSPSVIPTYLPSVRVWEYNTTRSAKDESLRLTRAEQDRDDDLLARGRHVGWWHWLFRFLSGTSGRDLRAEFEASQQRDPNRHSSRHSPWRTNTYLTPLAYTQYYIPEEELERANKAARRVLKSSNGTDPGSIEPPRWSVEYTTLSTSEAAYRLLEQRSPFAGADNQNRSPSSHDPLLIPGLLPPPLQNLLATPPSAAKFHRVRRMLNKLDLTPYNGVLSAREGLTVGAWIDMAKWVSKKGAKRWEGFRQRMGVGSGEL